MSMGSPVGALTLAVAIFAAQGADQTDGSPAPGPGAITRISIDRFAGYGSNVVQARESAIAALFSLKRFAITEECDKADATLKDSVVEREDQRTRAEGESAGIAASRGFVTGHADKYGASVSGAGRSVATGSDEQLFSSETRRQASVSMRITDRNGEVLWACTQDSPGGKTKTAVTDAVERAVVQLRRELERSAQLPTSGAVSVTGTAVNK